MVAATMPMRAAIGGKRKAGARWCRGMDEKQGRLRVANVLPVDETRKEGSDDEAPTTENEMNENEVSMNENEMSTNEDESNVNENEMIQNEMGVSEVASLGDDGPMMRAVRPAIATVRFAHADGEEELREQPRTGEGERLRTGEGATAKSHEDGRTCKLGHGEAGEGDSPMPTVNGASTTAVVAMTMVTPRDGRDGRVERAGDQYDSDDDNGGVHSCAGDSQTLSESPTVDSEAAPRSTSVTAGESQEVYASASEAAAEEKRGETTMERMVDPTVAAVKAMNTSAFETNGIDADARPSRWWVTAP
ncbi:hypothetical protein ON010_g18221 [Phytophthora cinnamomi]|nr:hypothetical protein ON010_g18221 [Phytophthora cinnamomi]